MTTTVLDAPNASSPSPSTSASATSQASPPLPVVELRGVGKRYGAVTALDSITGGSSRRRLQSRDRA